ncbi:hypothetical protein [Deinococcus sp.]|uniref:hypothetical protein n=1 Tax=Deinococcus sp. TaxID=47478 RepID=UPI003C7B3476
MRTTLFQTDTRPSEEWRPWPGGWVFPGRHPAVVANTAVTLEEGLTAAVMLGSLPQSMTVLELAGLIVHEAFHVYQSTHRPERWQADELAVFGYPLTRGVLAARRLETLALSRALEDEAGWPGHAAEALHWRTQRFAHLSAAQTELERGLERLEGLAHFVELKVTGQPPRWPLPDFAPAQIRGRCYATGAAMAVLLDRTGAWMAGFMDSTLSLDELLSNRLAGHRTELAPELVTEAEKAATLDTQNVERELTLKRQAHLNQSGPRLTLTSIQRLWLRGFDPLKITDMGGGRALHTRFLRFGNAQVSGEILGRATLTTGAGEHPLLNGFSALVLTGLESPRVWSDEYTLHVQAQGVELEITGATRVEESMEGWAISLP